MNERDLRMNAEPLAPGLYLTATPIGNARDITLRALDVLRSADVLVAEDTRTLRKLLDIHGISLGNRAIFAHHDHSNAKARDGIVRLIADGKSVAYCSDAGSPLIADPGFELVQAIHQAGLKVTVLPGASSVVAALSIAGIPTDRFCFLGFAPKQGSARRKFLREANDIPATLVIFETAKRVSGLLEEMCEELGETRIAGLGRELTKRFEEMRRGTLAQLHSSVQIDPPKGEIVLIVDRGAPKVVSDEEIDAALAVALSNGSMRDAVDQVTRELGAPRRAVYQRGLALGREEGREV